MPNFHRYYIPQSIVFITCVTHQRTPYLGSLEHLELFWKVVRREQKVQSFRLLAYIILPDHFHWLMQMPESQPNFSLPIGRIKRNFAMGIKQLHREINSIQVWQERFWDHIIRDEDDLERHIDYIHYNPVKHGCITDPGDWRESSFSYWVNKGYYQNSWGIIDTPNSISGMDFE